MISVVCIQESYVIEILSSDSLSFLPVLLLFSKFQTVFFVQQQSVEFFSSLLGSIS